MTLAPKLGEDGQAAGGGGDGGSPASASGASTTLTLTPDGAGHYFGFTTLALSGVQLSARLQAVLGDIATCELVTATLDGGPMSVQVTDTGACVP